MRNTARTLNAHELKARIAEIYARTRSAKDEDYFGLLAEGLKLRKDLIDAPVCVCAECVTPCEELDGEN